jgi:hypothetical protein
MTTFDFNAVLSAYLTQQGVEHEEIDDWSSDSYISRGWGGCESCGPGDEIVETVYIYYWVKPTGRRKTRNSSDRGCYTTNTSFSQFLRELIEMDVAVETTSP